MSDSVLCLSDSGVAPLQVVTRDESGLACRSSVARWSWIASRRCPRSRDPHAIRLIRRIGGHIDSAASSRRSITTALRSAVQHESGSAHGVVARSGPSALRTAWLATVLNGDPGRAGHGDGLRAGRPTQKPGDSESPWRYSAALGCCDRRVRAMLGRGQPEAAARPLGLRSAEAPARAEGGREPALNQIECLVWVVVTVLRLMTPCFRLQLCLSSSANRASILDAM
jgi:hypothetical protein